VKHDVPELLGAKANDLRVITVVNVFYRTFCDIRAFKSSMNKLYPINEKIIVCMCISNCATVRSGVQMHLYPRILIVGGGDLFLSLPPFQTVKP
jgi:hypothetical protein